MRTVHLFNHDNRLTKRRELYFLLAFILLYFINLYIGNEIKVTGEAAPIIIIFGLFFTSLAWAVTRNYKTDLRARVIQPYEPYLITALVVYITVVIILGSKIFFLPVYDGWAGELIKISRKVLTFVVIPFLVYKALYNFSLKDFGLSLKWKDAINSKSILIWAIFSAILLLLNFFAGNGAKPLREGIFTSSQILKAIPFFTVWLLIEVGLVEEFFFRGVLQNRLGVILRSKTGAICISALIFGLVHAPGMYLRQAGVNDGLGTEPSLLNTIVYCIAIQSVPGLFLGILWERTRNLWLLIGIHAMFDLMPGLAGFITVWGIR